MWTRGYGISLKNGAQLPCSPCPGWRWFSAGYQISGSSPQIKSALISALYLRTWTELFFSVYPISWPISHLNNLFIDNTVADWSALNSANSVCVMALCFSFSVNKVWSIGKSDLQTPIISFYWIQFWSWRMQTDYRCSRPCLLHLTTCLHCCLWCIFFFSICAVL